MPLRHTLLAFAAAALVVAAPPAHAASVDPPARAAFELVDDAPQPFRLSTARPNPFATSSRIELSLDEPTTLTVAMYDALGRRVALLHEGFTRPGTYSLRLEAGDLPPGLYIVRAHDGRGTTATRSVALVR